MFSRVMLTLFFLTATVFAGTTEDIANKNGGRRFLMILEDRFELKLEESVSYFTKWLEDFNDRHLGRTGMGRMLHYDQIKAKFEADSIGAANAQSGRSRKMAMAMIPLIFHLGATSVWMVLTTILTLKSVAIGMTLLIFKIAAGSAKLASFFTHLKSKHDHQDWSWSPPHHEHYGHKRSFSDVEHDHPPADWQPYSSELTHHDAKKDHYPTYETVPSSSYKRNDNLTPYEIYKNFHRGGKDKKFA